MQPTERAAYTAFGVTGLKLVGSVRLLMEVNTVQASNRSRRYAIGLLFVLTASLVGQDTAPDLAKTYLGRGHEFVLPGEPIEVLEPYIELNAHDYLARLAAEPENLDKAIERWEGFAKKYPNSPHALLGRARLLQTKATAIGDTRAKRDAADALKAVALFALGQGKIRFTKELAEALVLLGDKQQLDESFQQILASPRDLDRTHYYLALVDYAQALTQLGDVRASQYFEEAVAFHPENNIEAINLYARFLLDQGKPQRALEILEQRLTSRQRIRFVMPAHLRREALQKLGASISDADAEIDIINRRLSNGMGIVQKRTSASSPGVRTKNAGVLAAYQHTYSQDDCRDPNYNNYPYHCIVYPDGTEHCFYAHAINVAEVLYNEARGENWGAIDMVGWTVRDRAFQGVSCDSYIGGINSSCRNSLSCGQMLFCPYDKYYCCVVHGGTTSVGALQSQFNDSHVTWSTLAATGLPYEVIEIQNGRIVEMSTGFVPPGASACGNTCNDNFCYYGSNVDAPSPLGPMEYLSKDYEAQASSCKWKSGAVCGNGGVSDNHFWNRLN